MFASLRLAWQQLSYGKVKMAVASAGVVVAVLLMHMQLGFLRAAIDSTLVVPRLVRSELIVMSPRTSTMFRTSPFPRRLLYRLPAHPDVASVQGVYLGNASWRNPWNHKTSNIFVYGLEPFEPLLQFDGLEKNQELLKQADAVLFDEGARPYFGPVAQAVRETGSLEAEVNNRKIRAVGLTRAGVTVGVDGSLVTSDTNFYRLFPSRKPGSLDLGLVKLKPGVAPERVAAELAGLLGAEARVLTKEQFRDLETKFMRENGPIEFIFTMGAAVGFFIGFVIVYQILHSDVSHHLPKYATMKAIGFTDTYLLRMVLSQAMILAVLGFIPGLGLSWTVYEVAKRATLLPVEMTLDRVALVFTLTLIMCGLSGAIAVRKLRAADPADVF